MKWGKWIRICFTLMLVVVLAFQVEGARVNANTLLTGAPQRVVSNPPTGGLFIYIGTQTQDTSHGYASCSLTIDGVAISTYAGLFKTTGEFVGIGASWTTATAYLADNARHLVRINYVGNQYYPTDWSWTGYMLIKNNNALYDPLAETLLPLSVSLSGSDSVGVGVQYALTGNISGGVGPYTARWTVLGDEASVGPVHGVVGTSDTFHWTWHHIQRASVRVDVTDSLGSSASALQYVNVGSYAPSMMAQLGRVSGQTRFMMYLKSQDVSGSLLDWATGIPTSTYSVSFGVAGQEYAYYVDGDALPLPNPYVVAVVNYTDPTTGLTYQYSFSFDTTNFGADGTWSKSDGSTGAGSIPDWLRALVNMLLDGLKWLFVPTSSQLSQIMPTAAMGSELAGFSSWGSGGSGWQLVVHWPKVGGGTYDITLVNMDFSAVRAYGFVTVIRLGVQAMIAMGLLYLIVGLI